MTSTSLVAPASTRDISWYRCYFTVYTGGATRNILVNGDAGVTADAADGRFSLPCQILADANHSIVHDGDCQLTTITADRTLTLTAPTRPGQLPILINRHGAGSRGVGGANPVDPAGTAVAVLPPEPTMVMTSDAVSLLWRLVSVWSPGRQNATISKTAAYTLTDSDHTIQANATGAAFALTLPTAVGRTGRQFQMFKTDASANAVTINTTSSQTISGSASGALALSAQHKYLRVESDGTNWVNIGSN